MKSKNSEAAQRILLLLKIDANNLFNRIQDRKSEYLEIFALRRTREHFPMIFKNRYEGITIMDLAHCSPEVITTLDQYYTLVDEMSWYLFQTEDMPNTVEDYINRKISRMGKILNMLNLLLNVELGVDEVPEARNTPPVFINQSDEDFSDVFDDDNPEST